MKASQLDVLEWIMQRRRVWYWELAEHFGFTRPYAEVLLCRLKRRGLVNNRTKGMWVLTEEGFKKLKYHGRRQEGQ